MAYEVLDVILHFLILLSWHLSAFSKREVARITAFFFLVVVSHLDLTTCVLRLLLFGHETCLILVPKWSRLAQLSVSLVDLDLLFSLFDLCVSVVTEAQSIVDLWVIALRSELYIVLIWSSQGRSPNLRLNICLVLDLVHSLGVCIRIIFFNAEHTLVSLVLPYGWDLIVEFGRDSDIVEL